MLNVVVLMGRLVADPELKHTPGNVPVTSFRIAVDRSYVKQGAEREADFINVVAWRERAEFVSKYFAKGQLIAVEGSLQSRNFVDKDNNKRTAYEVVANAVHFAESKRPAGDSQFSEPAAQQPQQQASYSTADPGDFQEIGNDDDLPF